MGHGTRIAIGVPMAVIGLFFLVTGYLGDAMWFPARRDMAASTETPLGVYPFESDPVGYMMAAALWALIVAVGTVLLYQGASRRRPRR